MEIGRLHVITPDVSAEQLPGVVAPVVEAGAPVVQLRVKDQPDRAWLTGANALRDLCSPPTALLVNDRADIALAAGADGCHVGADDLPVAVVRQLLGPDAIVGGTCRNPDAARRAEDEGASYVGAGPVYASTTKSGLPDPLGPAGIERIAAAVSIPVIAISGVTVDRVRELIDAGAHGVAVVGAVFSAAQPGAAVRAFLDALESSG